MQTATRCVQPSYTTTNLVVVRQKGPSGLRDVELDCLGTIDGWHPVGVLGTFEVAHVDLVRFGVPVKECATPRHVARSEGAFGVTVWGTDCSASYGYAAGGDFGPANDVVGIADNSLNHDAQRVTASLHETRSAGSVHRARAFCSNDWGEVAVVPHAAFAGQMPDEMYSGRGGPRLCPSCHRPCACPGGSTEIQQGASRRRGLSSTGRRLQE